MGRSSRDRDPSDSDDDQQPRRKERRHDEDRDRHRSSRDRKRSHRDRDREEGKGKDSRKKERSDCDRKGGDDKDRRSDERRKRSRRERSPSPTPSMSSSSSFSSSLSRNGDDDGNSSDSQRRRKRHDKKSKSRRKEDKKKSSKKKPKDNKKHKKSKKKHKRHDKEDRKHGKKHKKSRREEKHEVSAEDQAFLEENSRNFALAEALHDLLVEYPTPSMATETLPLVLIKLGGGTTLDLRQMPDKEASAGLGKVLTALKPFGVANENDHPQIWKWTVPGGGAAPRDERFLLRIVRTMLNDIGFTMTAIQENEQQTKRQLEPAPGRVPENEMVIAQITTDDASKALAKVNEQTMEMLQSFLQKQKNASKVESDQQFTLPGELGGLCKMILDGESIALDGLPDTTLRAALERLFQTCGLDLNEIEDEDESGSDDDERDNEKNEEEEEKTLGYGLPDAGDKQDTAREMIMSVMNACEQAASSPSTLLEWKKPTVRKGPMPMPAGYQVPDESSDEEGPAPVGAAARRQEAAISRELVKQQAEMRARQLRGALTGQAELMSDDPNQREEWMLDPGKFDFLSSIKAGNPMKSRNFKAQSKARQQETSERAMDPKVKAEMDAIMQAHADARGPTLVEQHRLKKEQERKEAAASGGKKGKWNWNRDKDLDAGRRVDKNALHMVMGGANKDLKTKFQGGF